MHDYNHNLIHSLSERLDSLWRYDDYIKNAKGCEKCQNIWKKLREVDLECAELLREEIKKHVEDERFESCSSCFTK